MSPFDQIVRYNAWANQRLAAVLATVHPDRLRQPVDGIYGSLEATFLHLVTVEHAYLRLLAANPPKFNRRSDLAACLEALPLVDEAYIRLTANLAPGAEETVILIPWFKREVSLADALLQMALHSTAHRADLSSALSRLGTTPPPLDYIVWTKERAVSDS